LKGEQVDYKQHKAHVSDDKLLTLLEFFAEHGHQKQQTRNRMVAGSLFVACPVYMVPFNRTQGFQKYKNAYPNPEERVGRDYFCYMFKLVTKQSRAETSVDYFYLEYNWATDITVEMLKHVRNIVDQIPPVKGADKELISLQAKRQTAEEGTGGSGAMLDELIAERERLVDAILVEAAEARGIKVDQESEEGVAAELEVHRKKEKELEQRVQRLLHGLESSRAFVLCDFGKEMEMKARNQWRCVECALGGNCSDHEHDEKARDTAPEQFYKLGGRILACLETINQECSNWMSADEKKVLNSSIRAAEIAHKEFMHFFGHRTRAMWQDKKIKETRATRAKSARTSSSTTPASSWSRCTRRGSRTILVKRATGASVCGSTTIAMARTPRATST
jgi:hypothetical protein